MVRTLLARREIATDNVPALFPLDPLLCVTCIALNQEAGLTASHPG
jgi:hypothetical protein